MKKVLMVMMIAICSIACKDNIKIEKSVSTGDTLNRHTDAEPADKAPAFPTVYSGMGTFNSSGGKYLISLPTSVNSTHFKQFYIFTDYIFIHLDNGSELELSNAQNRVYEYSFSTGGMDLTKSYKVVLCHDKSTISRAAAQEIIDEVTKNFIELPKKVGYGILSPK